MKKTLFYSLILTVFFSLSFSDANADCSKEKGINAIMACIGKFKQHETSKSDAKNDGCEEVASADPHFSGAWSSATPFSTGHITGTQNFIRNTGSEINNFTMSDQGGMNDRLLDQMNGKGDKVKGGNTLIKEGYQETTTSTQSFNGSSGATDVENVDIKTEIKTLGEGQGFGVTPEGGTVTATTHGRTPARALANALSDIAAMTRTKIDSSMTDHTRSKCKNGESTETETTTGTLTTSSEVAITGYEVTGIKKAEGGGYEVTVTAQPGKTNPK